MSQVTAFQNTPFYQPERLSYTLTLHFLRVVTTGDHAPAKNQRSALHDKSSSQPKTITLANFFSKQWMNNRRSVTALIARYTGPMQTEKNTSVNAAIRQFLYALNINEAQNDYTENGDVFTIHAHFVRNFINTFSKKVMFNPQTPITLYDGKGKPLTILFTMVHTQKGIELEGEQLIQAKSMTQDKRFVIARFEKSGIAYQLYKKPGQQAIWFVNSGGIWREVLLDTAGCYSAKSKGMSPWGTQFS